MGSSRVAPAEEAEREPDGARVYEPDPALSPAPGPLAAAPEELGRLLTQAALDLGFARIGFAPAERFQRGARALEAWLDQGHAGTMTYLRGGSDRAEPRALLEKARTIVTVALPYASGGPLVPLRNGDGAPLTGSIARYARGRDYHLVLKERLHLLAVRAASALGRPVLARACVDTAPLLEREAAARAGIAFLGKNTLAIVAGLGSYVLLGELLIDAEIEPGAAAEPRCGACRACLDACPTQAFLGPYVLDARRCISYLTIEYSGVVPLELRAAIGTRIFGCDVCQEVCPYNATSATHPVPPELAPRPEVEPAELVRLLELGSAQYRKFVKRSSLRRASRQTLARNAAIALGNTHDPRAELPLVRALSGHSFALVRGHAAWALGELGECAGAAARTALGRASACDEDSWVREEAASALTRLAGSAGLAGGATE